MAALRTAGRNRTQGAHRPPRAAEEAGAARRRQTRPSREREGARRVRGVRPRSSSAPCRCAAGAAACWRPSLLRLRPSLP
eukprot:5282621-Prymnesium_polylepis.1